MACLCFSHIMRLFFLLQVLYLTQPPVFYHPSNGVLWPLSDFRYPPSSSPDTPVIGGTDHTVNTALAQLLTLPCAPLYFGILPHPDTISLIKYTYVYYIYTYTYMYNIIYIYIYVKYVYKILILSLSYPLFGSLLMFLVYLLFMNSNLSLVWFWNISLLVRVLMCWLCGPPWLSLPISRWDTNSSCLTNLCTLK